MADLVHEFFERDLGEQEAERLKDLIQDGEQALAFSAEAERAYALTGLSQRSLRHERLAQKALVAKPLIVAVGVTVMAWGVYRLSREAPPPPIVPAALVPAAVEPTVVRTWAPPVGPAMQTFKAVHIRLSQSLGELVEVSVFDAEGALVRNLHRGPLLAGQNDLLWDGLDSGGRQVRPGVYRVQVKDDKGIEQQEILVGTP